MEERKMNAFDKVIGYETIKNELLQICDMIRNKEVYEEMGAKPPQGILLYGDPGLGKTLMAKSFIEESGLKAYTVRRNKGGDDFVSDITDTFSKAKENSPCIILLDDMDKFANEDSSHRDAEEYVAVQSGIDEIKGCDVFVFATANNVQKLPRSLVRSGRFDRKIEVQHPVGRDADEIIAHYLSGKKIAEDVNVEDLSRMISYCSCAELETILNEAAITAAYERKQTVGMADFVKAVLKMQYEFRDNYTKTDTEEIRKRALHEAGHLVVAEVLCPGSVGLASICSGDRNAHGGFIHRCKDISRRAYDVLISLAGKAAVELYYADTCAGGCQSDISRAVAAIREGVSANATLGFGVVDVETRVSLCMSENLNSRNEAVTQAELERYMLKARDILLKNRDFLEKAAEALAEKETLLYSDIQRIKSSVTVTNVVV